MLLCKDPTSGTFEFEQSFSKSKMPGDLPTPPPPHGRCSCLELTDTQASSWNSQSSFPESNEHSETKGFLIALE